MCMYICGAGASRAQPWQLPQQGWTHWVVVPRVRMEAGLNRTRQLPVTATTSCACRGQVPLLEPRQWGPVLPPVWPCSSSSLGTGAAGPGASCQVRPERIFITNPGAQHATERFPRQWAVLSQGQAGGGSSWAQGTQSCCSRLCSDPGHTWGHREVSGHRPSAGHRAAPPLPTALGTGDIPWKPVSHLPRDFPFIFPVSYIEGAAIRHITLIEQKGHDISDAGRIDYVSDSWHV